MVKQRMNFFLRVLIAHNDDLTASELGTLSALQNGIPIIVDLTGQFLLLLVE